MNRVTERLTGLGNLPRTVLLAVDGLGGSGKTTLAAAVASRITSSGGRVDVVHFDDFYLPSALRSAGKGAQAAVGGHFDWRRLRDEVLLPLREERPAHYRRYDWGSDALAETREVRPGGLVLVEGVGSMRNELAELYDLRVWVECSREVRLQRGLDRDGEDHREVWEQDWMPAEERYRSEHRPDRSADLIVSGEAD